MNKSKMIKIINVILVIIFVILLCPKSMQNDTLWSIKVGEDIIDGGIPEIDDWSIHENLKSIAHHYILDIIIYFVYTLFGFFGLYILEIICALIVALLMYKININFTNNSKLAYIFLYVQMFLIMPFISVRAQMVSLIIFLIEFIVLEKMYNQFKKRYVIILGGVLPLVLANLHMGVLPFYFIIEGVYIVASIRFSDKNIISKNKNNVLKWLIVSGIIGLIVIFINPYGLDGVTYGVKTVFSQTIGNIKEFKPLSFGHPWGILMFGYTFLIVIIAIINKRFCLKDVLLVLGTLFMTCISIRYMMYYIVFSSVILKYLLKIKIDFSKADMLAIDAVKYTVIVILSIGLFFVRIEDTEYISKDLYPVRAYQNVRKYITPETIIFNEWGWGSYLKLNNEKVFIDSRGDLYTEEYNEGVTVFKDYLDIELKYKEIIEKYDINMFLIRSDRALATILSVDNDFDEIYKDDVASVYVKKK